MGVEGGVKKITEFNLPQSGVSDAGGGAAFDRGGGIKRQVPGARSNVDAVDVPAWTQGRGSLFAEVGCGDVVGEGDRDRQVEGEQ